MFWADKKRRSVVLRRIDGKYKRDEISTRLDQTGDLATPVLSHRGKDSHKETGKKKKRIHGYNKLTVVISFVYNNDNVPRLLSISSACLHGSQTSLHEDLGPP